MPRVTTVKKARKSQGECGACGVKIKKGDPYRWWKFRYGGRHVRCGKPECAPKAGDLTQSAFYSQLYDIQDGVESAIANRSADDLRAAAEDLRNLGEECSSNRDNMPEGLQESDTGNLLQERADECESRASDLESAADELDELPENWQEYAENENVERGDDESEGGFESRVTELMTADADNAWESVDIDLSIS